MFHVKHLLFGRKMDSPQTIYALSSGPLPAAIAIIRISGPSATEALQLLGVKKLGGTRSGQIGTTVGLILALVILGPIGIIIGPFLGALLGEMTNNKSFNESLKPAFGSFIGVIAGSVIKFLISLSFLFFYFDIFWGYRESFF